MKIRTRTAGLILALTTTLTLASAGALVLAERKTLTENARQSRVRLAAQFARTCRDALLVHDELATVGAAQSLAQTPGILQAYVTAPNKRVVSHSKPGFVGKPLVAAFPSPDTWRVTHDLLRPGAGTSSLGVAVVDFSIPALTAEINASLAPVLRRIGWVAIIGCVAGALGAWALARSITKPILKISKGAHALANGRLSHRVEPLGGDELGDLAQDFNIMAERLGELDALKNAFVANVTHELRSPISAIESCAALMSDEIRAGSWTDMPEQITAIRNNATRLGRLVNNVLDLSRIDAGRTELSPELLSAKESIEEVVALFRPKALEKSIDLGLAPTLSDVTVWADPDMLTQILTNYLGNALKFTPRGGRILLGARGEGRGTLLFVQDTGPGIRFQDQGRIFGRFEQVRETRDRVEGLKGTGLGLAIAKGLAEAHGGHVGLRSEVGKGSVFYVWFPEVT